MTLRLEPIVFRNEVQKRILVWWRVTLEIVVRLKGLLTIELRGRLVRELEVAH